MLPSDQIRTYGWTRHGGWGNSREGYCLYGATMAGGFTLDGKFARALCQLTFTDYHQSPITFNDTVCETSEQAAAVLEKVES